MQNTTIPFSSILVEDRLRKDLGDIESLAESIAEIGLICPLTVEEMPDGTHRLRAGGRRYAAITRIRHQYAMDEFPRVEAGEVARQILAATPFNDVPVYILHNLSASHALMVEIEENLRRKEMTWQETAVGIKQVHDEHVRQNALEGEKWTQQATGDLLGEDRAKVLYALKIADQILSGDEEIIKCENMFAAFQLLQRRAQRAVEKHQATLKQAALAVRKDVAASAITLVRSEDGHTETIETQALPDMSDAALSKYERACSIIHLADSHEVMQGQQACFDGIYTDIPYGINMENLDLKHINETKEAHDQDDNIRMFSDFLRLSYLVTKPESFVVFWMDVEHTTLLSQLAKEVGFRVQRWPLHAFKGEGKNEAASYNTTKDYESVLVCAKTNALLQQKRSSSLIPWNWQKGEAEQYAHPFAKPHSANEWLLKTFFPPNAHLLDPYCGEGSLVLSGLKLGYQMTGIDKEEHHVIRARNHVEKLLTV